MIELFCVGCSAGLAFRINGLGVESTSALASVAPLVQYCINTCSAVDAVQRRFPATPGARSPVSGNKIFRRKGRPDERHRSVGRTGFREMIASGWRTAPPQVFDFEVVLATNSACQLSLEASPVFPIYPVSPHPRVSPSALRLSCSNISHRLSSFCSRASASPILSAPR